MMGWMAPVRHLSAKLLSDRNSSEWEPSMGEVTTIGLDLSQHAVQVHADDALWAGEDGRPASCRAAAPWPGAAGTPAYGSGERFARASGRVRRDRATGLAQRRQADRHCPRRARRAAAGFGAPSATGAGRTD